MTPNLFFGSFDSTLLSNPGSEMDFALSEKVWGSSSSLATEEQAERRRRPRGSSTWSRRSWIAKA